MILAIGCTQWTQDAQAIYLNQQANAAAAAVIRETLMVEMEINIKRHRLSETLPLAPVTQRSSFLGSRHRRQRQRAKNKITSNTPHVLMSLGPAGDAKWRKVASSRRRVNQPDHYPN